MINNAIVVPLFLFYFKEELRYYVESNDDYCIKVLFPGFFSFFFSSLLERWSMYWWYSVKKKNSLLNVIVVLFFCLM